MGGTGGGIGMRTVWINLRAMNYTDQAFRSSIGNMKKLNDIEKEEYQNMVKRRDAARYGIQTNMLYAASLAMITTQLWGFLNLTQSGAGFMGEFNTSLTQMKSAFADTLFTALKPVLEVIMQFMNAIRDNGPLRAVAITVALLAIGIGALYLSYKMINGVIELNNARHALADWIKKKHLLTNAALTGSNNVLAMSFQRVAGSLGIVVTAFMLFMTLKDYIGPVATAIIASIVAIVAAIIALKAVSTFGATLGKDIAMVAGSVAVGAGLAAGVFGIQAMSSKAVGTRMVSDTGPQILHKGEMVYNPSVNRPAGIEKQVMGDSSTRSSPSTVTVNFNGDINTKSSEEDIDVVFQRKIYRAIKGAS